MEFELIQFKENDKIITYMPDFPRSWYNGMDISVIFKVKMKDNRSWFQRNFLNFKWKRYWSKHLIANQIH